MGTYRLEEASTGRAGCQNKECKDEKIKILKGELRLGTWVDTERFQSFFWRHWGCVTPKIIANLKETLDEAGGDEDEKDYTIFDGYEELSAENQAKVREAVEQGHVADSDWKGDVEMNRPGKTGFRTRTPKKQKADVEDKGTDSDAEEESPKAKKRGRGAQAAGKVKDDKGPPAAKKAKEAPASKDDVETAEASQKVAKPAAKRGRPSKTATPADEKPDNEIKSAAKGRKRKPADDTGADAGTPAVDDSGPKPSKRGRKSAVAKETVAVDDKPKRGRKKAASTEQAEAVEDAPPADKPKRGRKKAAA